MLFLAAPLAFAACSPPPPRPDGDPSDDASADAPRGSTPLFGPCGGERECAAALGVTCLSTFPGGLCVRRCDTSEQCGPRGACRFHVCLPGCSLGTECAAFGGACDLAPVAPGSSVVEGACLPACAVSGPGRSTCPAGLACDEYTGACTSEAPAGGGGNGASCREPENCRSGQCVGEVRSDGNPSGFVGGYCVSNGVMVARDAIRDGAPMPRSNCPTGSAVLPLNASEGQRVTCMQGCTGDGECRAGYRCERFENALGVRTSTGLCWPINCAEAGRACPGGYRCVMAAAGGSGACARSL